MIWFFVWQTPFILLMLIIGLASRVTFTSSDFDPELGLPMMAMETLACGVPTLVSANTGHLDLLAMGFGHALPMGQAGLGQVDPAVQRAYGDDPLGLWGETDSGELLEWWMRIAANRDEWRIHGCQYAEAVKSLSWRESMRKLLSVVETIPD